MGTLYIVATPIGNLEDITIRALRVLSSVDIIVSEDPRATSLLLQLLKSRFPEYFILGQKEKIIPFNEFQEEFKIFEVINLLKEDKKIAFVTEAGTPLISDPGFKLVREARKLGQEIVAIPGVSSPITALSISGLPTDKFLFLGFLPKSSVKTRKVFEDLKSSLTTLSEKKLNPSVILFDSPHRIISTLQELQKVFGDIPVFIGRELTKKFEEARLENITTQLEYFKSKEPKGEFTLIFKFPSS